MIQSDIQEFTRCYFPSSWGRMTRGQNVQLLTEKISHKNPDPYKGRILGKLKVHKALLATGVVCGFKAQVTITPPHTIATLKGS